MGKKKGFGGGEGEVGDGRNTFRAWQGLAGERVGGGRGHRSFCFHCPGGNREGL